MIVEVTKINETQGLVNMAHLLEGLSVGDKVTFEVSGAAEPAQNKKPQNKKYDFSDIAGTLSWKGDAVKEQRRLRDEWN